MKIFKDWWGAAEAHDKAAKAHAELEAVRSSIKRDETESLVSELALGLRLYADEARTQTHNQSLIFADEDLRRALGPNASLFEQVMESLEESGHAKRSFKNGYWEVGPRLSGGISN